MIAKGNVELFTVAKKDLFKLRFHYHNLPLEFLKSIDLFTSYPFENLMQNNETVMYQYFGFVLKYEILRLLKIIYCLFFFSPNQIISRDADDSPWLYVVKSVRSPFKLN